MNPTLYPSSCVRNVAPSEQTGPLGQVSDKF